MNLLDIIIGGFLIYGIFKGFSKGIIIEIASLIGIVLGIYGAIHFSNIFNSPLSSILPWNDKIIQLISFSLVFIGIILGVSVLSKFLTKVVKIISLGIFNKIAGSIFGGLKIAVILGVIVVFLDNINFLFPIIDKDIINDSLLYSIIKDFGKWAFKWAIEEKTTNVLDKIY